MTARISRRDRRVEAAIDALTRSLSGWRLRNLAEIADLSPSYLEHLIKSEMNVSMRQLSSALRLHVASMELRTTEMSIKEIRLRCGYLDACNFNHAFNAHFRCAPRQFRQLLGRSASDQRSQDLPTECTCSGELFHLVSVLLAKLPRESVGTSTTSSRNNREGP